MGAKLVNKYNINLVDPADEGDGWSFTLTIPPLKIISEIQTIMAEHTEKQRKLGVKIAAKIDPTAEDFEAAKVEAMKQLSPEELSEAISGPTIEQQKSLADIIKPYCSQPKGLLDDEDQPLSWEAALAENEIYIVGVLFHSACIALSNTTGPKGTVTKKK